MWVVYKGRGGVKKPLAVLQNYVAIYILWYYLGLGSLSPSLISVEAKGS